MLLYQNLFLILQIPIIFVWLYIFYWNTRSLKILKVSSKTNLNQDFRNYGLWFQSLLPWFWWDSSVPYSLMKSNFIEVTLIIIPMDTISIYAILNGGLTAYKTATNWNGMFLCYRKIFYASYAKTSLWTYWKTIFLFHWIMLSW